MKSTPVVVPVIFRFHPSVRNTTRVLTQDEQQRLAPILEQWLSIDSTSGREREFLGHLESFFDDDGWTVERQQVAPKRWNLIIGDGHPLRLLFSTHVDTVPPFLPVRSTDEQIYGRGACDTKGGLLAMWAAAGRLRDQGLTGLGFLLVVGEEVDHCGAKKATDLELSPERIILCEPTRNRVVRAQRGMLRCTLCADGQAGHSAFPDDGQSAFTPLLDALQRLRNAPWPVDDILCPTTLNIGIIEGGVAANIFAPKARAELLFRAVGPVEPLLTRVRELAGDEIRVESPIYNDPVFFDPPDGVDVCQVPFNTDATYLRQLGPIWLVGPGDIRCAHGDDEHIEWRQLLDGIERYESLARHVFK